MKKITALLLLVATCTSFTACNNQQQVVTTAATEATQEMKTDIVGHWMAVSTEISATFNEDGTGIVDTGEVHSLTWKYDPTLKYYIVTTDESMNVIVGMENGMEYMSMMGIDFYRPENYDSAYDLMLSKRHEDIADLTAGMTKLELNTAYAFTDNISLKIKQVSKVQNESSYDVQLYYALTGSADLTASGNCTIILNSKYYLHGYNTAFLSTTSVELGSIEQPEEVLEAVYCFDLGGDSLTAVKDVIGVLYFDINDTQYYIDLSELF